MVSLWLELISFFAILKSSIFEAPKDRVVIPFESKNLYASSNGSNGSEAFNKRSLGEYNLPPLSAGDIANTPIFFFKASSARAILDWSKKCKCRLQKLNIFELIVSSIIE